VIWLTAPHFEAFVKSRHADPEEQKRRLRADNYRFETFALRTMEANANDIYAHNVAFFTVQDLSAPLLLGDRKKRDLGVYAWWKEGFGYFVTLELWDTATSSFVSYAESHAKSKATLPPLAVKNTRTLVDWMRELVVRREGHTIEEVVAKSLNGLDFVASIQAATFVRFLALFDPAAFQALPGALRAREQGAQAERVDAALQSAYGKGLDELAALWRAWLLEVA
jgi:hypothetical protein